MASFAELFFSLPDSLKGVIFNKMEDVRRLYHFHNISDELASIVSETHSLCIVLPYDFALASGEKAEWPTGLMEFLEKFERIDSISLLFSPPPPMDDMNYILKWRGDADGFVVLKARRLNAVPEQVHMDSRPTLHDLSTRVKYIMDLAERFPWLHKISNIDLANQGTIILDNQDIQNLKNGHVLFSKVKWKIWREATMEFSGTILKDILLHCEIEENGSEEELIKKAFPVEPAAELVAMIRQKEPFTESSVDIVKFFTVPIEF